MGFSDASKRGTGRYCSESRHVPGTYVLVLLTNSTNGHPLASVPESRVTVADPSTVLMARRKFPGTAASC